MKPSKPFVMPPVRIIPPTLEGQSESSKSLEEWLNTEETVRDLHFGKRTEEHMEYSYKSITNCTFQHLICRKFSVQSGIHILQTGGNQSAGNNIEPSDNEGLQCQIPQSFHE